MWNKGPVFFPVVQSCWSSTYVERAEHHGSPGAQHQEAPADAATAVHVHTEESVNATHVLQIAMKFQN